MLYKLIPVGDPDTANLVLTFRDLNVFGGRPWKGTGEMVFMSKRTEWWSGNPFPKCPVSFREDLSHLMAKLREAIPLLHS